MSTTIRVTDEAHRRLAAIAERDDRAMTSIVDEAIDALERRRFFDRFNERYTALAESDDEWTHILDERRHESGALGDAS